MAPSSLDRPSSRPSSVEAEPDYPEWVEWLLLWWTILRWLEHRLAATFFEVGIWFLRWGMAIVFIWFGAIKLHTPPPVISTFADAIWLLPDWFPAAIGVWEVIIGVCFLRRSWMRLGLLQLKVHMPGTFLPLIIIPHGAFSMPPMIPALPGLYVLKNLVFIGGGFVLWWHLIVTEDGTPIPPTS